MSDIGNLAERSDAVAGLTETFTYDALNRLNQHSLSGASNATLGNLTYKSDVGSYSYPASGAASVRPHAVAAITGSLNGVANPSYSYDANGNLTSEAGRSFTWTSSLQRHSADIAILLNIIYRVNQKHSKGQRELLGLLIFLQPGQ